MNLGISTRGAEKPDQASRTDRVAPAPSPIDFASAGINAGHDRYLQLSKTRAKAALEKVSQFLNEPILETTEGTMRGTDLLIAFAQCAAQDGKMYRSFEEALAPIIPESSMPYLNEVPGVPRARGNIYSLADELQHKMAEVGLILPDARFTFTGARLTSLGRGILDELQHPGKQAQREEFLRKTICINTAGEPLTGKDFFIKAMAVYYGEFKNQPEHQPPFMHSLCASKHHLPPPVVSFERGAKEIERYLKATLKHPREHLFVTLQEIGWIELHPYREGNYTASTQGDPHTYRASDAGVWAYLKTLAQL